MTNLNAFATAAYHFNLRIENLPPQIIHSQPEMHSFPSPREKILAVPKIKRQPPSRYGNRFSPICRTLIPLPGLCHRNEEHFPNRKYNELFFFPFVVAGGRLRKVACGYRHQLQAVGQPAIQQTSIRCRHDFRTFSTSSIVDVCAAAAAAARIESGIFGPERNQQRASRRRERNACVHSPYLAEQGKQAL